jgi:hypothetical protein
MSFAKYIKHEFAFSGFRNPGTTQQTGFDGIQISTLS